MPAKAREREISSSKVSLAFAELVQHEKFLRIRRTLSLVLFVGASAVWLAGLGKVDINQDVLPWYLTIATAASASVGFLRAEKQITDLVGLPRSKEPLKLSESLSICFLTAAVGLYLWIGFSLLHPVKPSQNLRQVVDIQLLSDRDYKDNKEDLPGQKEEQALRKRTGDLISQQGVINEPKTQQKKSELREAQDSKADIKAEDSEKKARQAPKTAKETNQEKDRRLSRSPDKEQKAQQAEEAAQAPQALPLMLPSSWQTKVVDKDSLPAATRAAAARRQAANQPYISEVAPPELVELVDNDGDPNAQAVFQKGGKSSGGKGAENGLSIYLKELHRRIKNAWSPPPGTTRRVEVIFRLKRDGHLAFLKIEKSSGEKGTDESAIKAITTAAAKAVPLPKDYSADVLDVLYTFKYNVNELEEINDSEN